MSDESRREEVMEILSLAAAAGMGALFMRHEMGPKPLLKSQKSLRNVAIGAALVSAVILGKSLTDYSKKGRVLTAIGFFTAAIGIAAIFASAKRISSPKVLTSGGPDVFKAQLGLLQLGYPVAVTGTMDQATKLALARFQATYSLSSQDGRLDAETSAYIEQAVHSSHQQMPFTSDTGYHPLPTTQT